MPPPPTLLLPAAVLSVQFGAKLNSRKTFNDYPAMLNVVICLFYSIDNIRMRGCFELNNQITAVNGKCQTSDVKCTVNKVEVCIKSRQQCDINIDCDNKEDEMVNCGKCGIFILLTWELFKFYFNASKLCTSIRYVSTFFYFSFKFCKQFFLPQNVLSNTHISSSEKENERKCAKRMNSYQ